MKKPLALFILFALTVGSQLPALADFNVTFGRHDYNHDRRWNYGEFERANREYYYVHPEVELQSTGELRRQFYRLDNDHDGYINYNQAQYYRNWD